MAKRKRKSDKRKAQSSAALRQNGLKAFRSGDYGRAIASWEQASKQTPAQQPSAALAEAYFRRGLKHFYGQNQENDDLETGAERSQSNRSAISNRQAGFNDIKKAAELQPEDPGYALHLGLAAHHLGKLDEAVAAYQITVSSQDEFARRAAYPLALALLQQGKDPADSPAWSNLATKDKERLNYAQALRQKAEGSSSSFVLRPSSFSSDAPSLWRGLVAVANGTPAQQARAELRKALQTVTEPYETALAHYYLGVLAAREEDWEDAERHWRAVRASGVSWPRLEVNLGELYHRLAEKRLLQDDPEAALAAAGEATHYKDGDKHLDQLRAQAQQRLAYLAANNGDWQTALEQWETARELERGSFRLAYNLALAYERDEDYTSAGDAWRETLRRRPRRSDHPDAINDEQVARLWQRAAEAYRQAGLYDEAVQVYRQAVKWNPENLTVRMALAEGLLANGRVQAAQNELDRVLERDPRNIPALLRQGEVIAQHDEWWKRSGAPQYWKKVLDIEPDNAEARQLLADFYQEQAEAYLQWASEEQALEAYKKALDYQPRSGRILAAIGGCYLRLGDEKQAQDYIDQALAVAPTDLKVYEEIIQTWLFMEEPESAWQVMKQAEAAVANIPYQFYISQAAFCLHEGDTDLARPWLDQAVAKAPPDEPVFVMIGEMAVMVGAIELGREYLEKAIAERQSPGQANLMLGIAAIREGDHKTAEKRWQAAEKLARASNDQELLERVQMARTFFSSLLGPLSLLLGGPGGPALPDLFDDEFSLEDLLDLIDEDNDDDFFNF